MLIFTIARHPRHAVLIAWTASVAGLAQAQAIGTVQQDRAPTLAASQTSSPVPPVRYTSVFDDLPKGVESGTADWKTSNANVGQFKRGHADVLKWEQEQAAKAAAKSTPPAKPAREGGQK